MDLIIIYLVGVIAAWFLLRKFRRNDKVNDHWTAICLCVIVSAISYIGCVIAIILLITEVKSKPPKWL